MANFLAEILRERAVDAHENHEVELKLVLEVLRDLGFTLVGQDRSEWVNKRGQKHGEHKLYLEEM